MPDICYPAHTVGYPTTVCKILSVVTVLQDHLRNTMSASHSRVLLLGAGFVVKPTLDILVDAGIDVTVGM